MTARYRVTSSLRFHDFVRSVSLLAVFFVCVVANDKNDVNVSTILPRPENAEPSPLTQLKTRELRTVGTGNRRRVPDSTVYPYSAVGLLRWNVSTCTATLVAANIVLTAAECLLDSDGILRESSQNSVDFTLSNGGDTMTASIVRVHKQSDYWTKWTRNSYVLVELDAEIGDAKGALLLPPAKTFAQDDPINVQLVGYGCNDASDECFQRCEIQFPSKLSDLDYLLHHDCDVSSTRSLGSPMLIRSTAMDTYIVGIYANPIGDDADDGTSSASHQGVLGSFIQPHLSFLIQQAGSLTSSDSLESFSTSSSSSFSADDEQSSYDGQDNLIDGGSSTAVDASTASASSNESSVTSSRNGIAPTAAYICIGLVCAAWLVIIVAFARKIRANHC